ncbi:MAG TPA: RodZ domain-containing protein [Gaiellaceae bacterium]
MFEIGNSLREARLRQGFELPRVEADTKIRAKYLRALEDERFELLPGETYVKGFLRTYAEYLGLDGQLYMDEYNSRFAREEEFPLASTAAKRPRPRRVESNFVVVALAGIVAVTILVVVAWKFGSSGAGTSDLLAGTSPIVTTHSTPTTSGTTSAGSRPTAPAPKLAKLVLTAADGDCWLQVRAGSARGELLYEGTLQQGQVQRFLKWKRLWIQLGAPAYLVAKLNGHQAKNFPRMPAVVVVTAKGVRTIST